MQSSASEEKLASAHTAVTSCTGGLCHCSSVTTSSASPERLLTVLLLARRPCADIMREGSFQTIWGADLWCTYLYRPRVSCKCEHSWSPITPCSWCISCTALACVTFSAGWGWGKTVSIPSLVSLEDPVSDLQRPLRVVPYLHNAWGVRGIFCHCQLVQQLERRTSFRCSSSRFLEE